MKYTFTSGFATKLNAFVEQKQSIGFPYEGSQKYLREFDRMCVDRFPNETSLTKEICMAWAVKKETEENNSFNNRLMPVREFAKFLIQTGEKAYVLETEFAKRKPARIPYIYSQEEILTLWNYYDGIKSYHNKAPAKPLVMAAIIRLLYCCGLRPAEATRLRTKDVELSKRKIYIRESKGHKDRIVIIPDDLQLYLMHYEQLIECYFPDRAVYFPNAQGGEYTSMALEKVFKRARNACGITGPSDTTPRLYDLRHTFATHRLYQWMKEGKNLSAMIPYLSAYMGHTDLSSTYYYIHLVPGQFEKMSGYDYSSFEKLIPEVTE